MNKIVLFLDRAVNAYWRHRWARLLIAVLQIVGVTVLSFCIQCRLEGIPVLTDISLWEVLVYMVEYHWRQVQWLIFRVQFWSNFDEDGNLFTYVPPSRPRMK